MLKQFYRCIFLGLCLPQLAMAGSWSDFWRNQNQQGAHLLAQKKYPEAAATFNDHNWKGVAYYRAQQYESAYAEFQRDHSARGWYNQGNSLAYLQKYPEAIVAYKQALKLQANYPDAEHNIKVLEKLQPQKDQQSPQSKEQDKKSSDKKEQNKSKDQADKDRQDKSKEQQENSKQKDHKDQNQQDKQNKQNQQDKQNDSKSQQEQKPQNQPTPKSAPTPLSAPSSQPSAKPTPTQPQAINSSPDNRQNEELRAALAQVPDDPGGLLRNKFLRDYQQQQQQQQQGASQ